MRRMLVALAVVAVMQLGAFDPWSAALAETPDDEAPTNAEIAASAGAVAGIVKSCGIDTAPIGSAFNAFLAWAKPASPNQTGLLREYETAEAAALSTPAEDNSGACAGATSMMRETVHSLTKPAS
jgi:hypothetical protein